MPLHARAHCRRPRVKRVVATASATALPVALSGCGKQSILSTHSPQAHNIVLLWWWMLAAAVIVLGGAVALLVLAYFRRGTLASRSSASGRTSTRGWC